MFPSMRLNKEIHLYCIEAQVCIVPCADETLQFCNVEDFEDCKDFFKNFSYIVINNLSIFTLTLHQLRG